MARGVSAKDARSKFSDLLGSLNYPGEEVIVDCSGRPVAAVILSVDMTPLRRLGLA